MKYFRTLVAYLILFTTFFVTQTNYDQPIDFENQEHSPLRVTQEVEDSIIKKEKKEWTFIVYMAADNDLHNFAARNIKQMAQIGTNKNINILVHLDIRLSGNRKVTRRYIIKKGKVLHVNANDPLSQKMDSGSSQTLISCCKWAIENYPANYYALIFWNHGTGILDPAGGRIINVANLFTFNPEINKFELDRSVGFLDLIKIVNEWRGVCWDDSTGHYLTNQKLDYALNEVCSNYLKGGKFSIIGFDACLMSMIEIANLTKKYADILVSSQEVELGMGWDYHKVLSPFESNSLSPRAFATHIVHRYKDTYNKITNDYTLSAIALKEISELEQNINRVALLLLTCLKQQANGSVKRVLHKCRNKQWCTHFDEPSYLDLHHFYKNLLQNLNHIQLRNKKAQEGIIQSLKDELQDGMSYIKEFAFATVAGKNLNNAQGISIYFPARKIHSSYRKSPFAKQNSWINLLNQYLLL